MFFSSAPAKPAPEAFDSAHELSPLMASYHTGPSRSLGFTIGCLLSRVHCGVQTHPKLSLGEDRVTERRLARLDKDTFAIAAPITDWQE